MAIYSVELIDEAVFRNQIKRWCADHPYFFFITFGVVNTYPQAFYFIAAERGDELLTEGKPGNKVYAICQGEVGIYQRGKPAHIIRTNGNVIGEFSAAFGTPASSTVKVESPEITCLVIDFSFLQKIKNLHLRKGIESGLILQAADDWAKKVNEAVKIALRRIKKSEDESKHKSLQAAQDILRKYSKAKKNVEAVLHMVETEKNAMIIVLASLTDLCTHLAKRCAEHNQNP